MRKHISDSRENPQLTTTAHSGVSGPLEHNLKRTGRVEQIGGRRKGWSLPNLSIKAETHRDQDIEEDSSS